MRCLAFAQGLARKRAESIFVIRDYEPRVAGLIRDYGYNVEIIPGDSSFARDAFLTTEFVSKYSAELVITDLSHTDNLASLDKYSRYFPALSAAQIFMINIDDLIRINFPYDIQIIPYYGAENINSRPHDSTKLLLGPAYFIFRQEFIEAAGVSRQIKEDAQNILVTMGGSDPLNLTMKIAKALLRLDKTSLNIRIVIGAGFAASARQELEKILKNYKGNCEFLMGSNNMAQLMLWSDLAVTGGGLTKYETAVTGTPNIIISHFDQEAARTREFEGGGSTLHLGLISEINEHDMVESIERLLKDHALRTEMSQRGRNMVDGKGMERIISEIPGSLLT